MSTPSVQSQSTYQRAMGQIKEQYKTCANYVTTQYSAHESTLTSLVEGADPFHRFSEQSLGAKLSLAALSAGSIGLTGMQLAKQKWVQHSLLQQRWIKFLLIPAALYFGFFALRHMASFLYNKYEGWSFARKLKNAKEGEALTKVLEEAFKAGFNVFYDPEKPEVALAHKGKENEPFAMRQISKERYEAYWENQRKKAIPDALKTAVPELWSSVDVDGEQLTAELKQFVRNYCVNQESGELRYDLAYSSKDGEFFFGISERGKKEPFHQVPVNKAVYDACMREKNTPSGWTNFWSGKKGQQQPLTASILTQSIVGNLADIK